MKTLSHGLAPVIKALHKGLCYIIGMYVMHGLESQIRKTELSAAGERYKHLWVKIAGRIKRHPPSTDDMPRVQYGGRKA